MAVYAERKVSAFIQDRVGPMEVGPRGLFQTIADIVKLLLKEHIVPSAADKLTFTLAPVIVFIAIFAGFAVIPLGPGATSANLNTGILYVMAIVAVDVIGLLLAGWASNNKYSWLGSVRSVSQILSYEIPAGLILLSIVVLTGTMNFDAIVTEQGILAKSTVKFAGFVDVTQNGGILSWNLFRFPHLLIGFVIYFIASLAQCNRAPFDLPEAESELISGFHTEYSGFRFAIFFLAEYASMLLTGLIIAVVFLGGWNTPLPNIYVGDLRLAFADWTTGAFASFSGYVWGVFWLLAKALFIVFLHMWIRWTVPRFRVDQLVKLSWKILTPAAFLVFLVSAIWRVLEVYSSLG